MKLIKMYMIIRKFKLKEIAFLREMLYLALYVPEGLPSFPKSILDNPEIAQYIEHWGTYQNDLALVAVFDDELVGAIWGRTFISPNVGFGFIDDRTPEISMAVQAEFRNQGMGAN